MNRIAHHWSATVVQLVQGALHAEPVVLAAPIPNQLAQDSIVGAGRPARVEGHVGPPHEVDAPVEVLDHSLSDIDLEGLQDALVDLHSGRSAAGLGGPHATGVRPSFRDKTSATESRQPQPSGPGH